MYPDSNPHQPANSGSDQQDLTRPASGLAADDDPFLFDLDDDEPEGPRWQRAATTAGIAAGGALLLGAIAAAVAFSGSSGAALQTNEELVVARLGTTTTTAPTGTTATGDSLAATTTTLGTLPYPTLTLPPAQPPAPINPAPSDDTSLDQVPVINVAAASATASAELNVGILVIVPTVRPDRDDPATDATASEVVATTTQDPATSSDAPAATEPPAATTTPVSVSVVPVDEVALPADTAVPAPTTTLDLGIIVPPTPISTVATTPGGSVPSDTATPGPDTLVLGEPLVTTTDVVDPVDATPPPSVGQPAPVTAATTIAPVTPPPPAPPTTPSPAPAVELRTQLESDPRVSTFMQIVGIADPLVLDEARPYTLFVPLNERLDALPNIDVLRSDPAAATQFVRAQMIDGAVDGALIAGGGTSTSLNGDPVQFGPDGVNGQVIVTPDLIGTSAVAHVVDGVVIPAPMAPGG
ncbi:MAG: fasciclin domain-containing protein [Desertimonas sp.]